MLHEKLRLAMACCSHKAHCLYINLLCSVAENVLVILFNIQCGKEKLSCDLLTSVLPLLNAWSHLYSCDSLLRDRWLCWSTCRWEIRNVCVYDVTFMLLYWWSAYHWSCLISWICHTQCIFKQLKQESWPWHWPNEMPWDSHPRASSPLLLTSRGTYRYIGKCEKSCCSGHIFFIYDTPTLRAL